MDRDFQTRKMAVEMDDLMVEFSHFLQEKYAVESKSVIQVWTQFKSMKDSTPKRKSSFKYQCSYICWRGTEREKRCSTGVREEGGYCSRHKDKTNRPPREDCMYIIKKGLPEEKFCKAKAVKNGRCIKHLNKQLDD